MDECRKFLEIQNVIEDENDDDWSFVPKAILDHSKRVIPRHVIKMYKNNNIDLQLERNEHLRMKVLWKDGSISWIAGDALQLHNPFIFIPYVIKRKLFNHKDFMWVNEYLKGNESYKNIYKIHKVKSNKQPIYKFGIQIPQNVQHAYKLDKINKDSGWEKSMDKEISSINEHQTFIILEEHEPLPEGYKQIPYHFVFDAKYDGRKKSRLVAGGHKAPEVPENEIYSGVVSIETIRVAFVLAAMNNLDVCAADVSTAFLYGKTKEKVYVIAGEEFGEHKGKRMLIDKGLYGLASSAARFHDELSSTLRKLGFVPSKADYDLWMRKVDDHYEYIATWVDDLLVFSKKPMEIIDQIKDTYDLKGVGSPEYYLGSDYLTVPNDNQLNGTATIDNEEKDKNLSPLWLKEGIKTAFSARTYIKNTIERLEQMIGREFPEFDSPMSESIHPEIDNTNILDPERHSHFRSLVGCANWLVILGRFDIAYAANTFSRFSNEPRIGHLKGMIRVFGYLKRYDKGKIIIDPNYPNHELYESENYDNWKEFYPEAEEMLPDENDKIEYLGPPVRITAYKDSDHAHDLVTRRSVTGILLFVNNTPVKWISKRQKTIETSTYGAELVAAKLAVETILTYRTMLRLMGANVEKKSLLLGDNKSVVINTTVPSSVLKKKHCALSYHKVREMIACNILNFAHIDSSQNYSDILTKALPRMKFRSHIKPLLFRNPIH